MTVIYLRSHKRRPIRLKKSIFTEDVQGSIPFGWCEGCGMECYEPGCLICPSCMRKELDYEKTELSLHPVCPGEKSPALRQ